MVKRTVKGILNDKKKVTENKFEKWVIADCLSHGTNEDIESYIYNIRQHGCVSGAVSSLIYYTDTEKTFKRFYNEILEIIESEKIYCNFEKIDFNTNDLTWLAYEIVINNLASWIE